MLVSVSERRRWVDNGKQVWCRECRFRGPGIGVVFKATRLVENPQKGIDREDVGVWG